jgi:hypothetical protein
MELPEVDAYKAAPSQETLGAMVLALNGVRRGDAMLPVLHRLFLDTGQWKIAQHLALALHEKDYAVHAMYFAHVAGGLSGGDPFTRLIKAKVLWLRRLPNAVVYETAILRAQARRLRDRRRRHLLQREIAELNILAHAYTNESQSTRDWLRFIYKNGTVSIRTALQIVLGFRTGADDLLEWAARSLATRSAGFGGRVVGAIQLGVRKGFIRVLRSR